MVPAIGCIDGVFGEAVEYDLDMDANSTRAQTHRWIWIASIWLAFGLVDAMQTVFVMRGEGMHHAWGRLFWTCVVGWIPWALATPLVEFLGRRFPPVKLRPLSMWLPHLVAWPAIGLIVCAWTSWLEV